MKYKNIGLVGYAKSGKSTFLSTVRGLGCNVTEIMIANHLKNVCSEVFGVPRDYFDDQNLKELPFANPFTTDAADVMAIMELFGLAQNNAELQLQTVKAHVGKKLIHPRHIAQYVGTEIIRSLDEQSHVRLAVENGAKAKGDFYVVTDIRFPNEFDYFSKVDNMVLVGIKRDAVAPADLTKVHASESHIKSLIERCHFVLENNGAVETYQKSCLDLVREITGKE